MRVGIIAEGKGDCAVLNNILYCLLDDNSDITFLRPEFDLDETDLAGQEMNAEAFSSWTLVQKDCQEQHKFHSFLVDNNILQEERSIIIQIDTAECSDYGINRPPKDTHYCNNLRAAVINQINNWLDHQFNDLLHYAVCIEETEAWFLPIYESKDSSTSADPKQKLERILQRKRKTDKNFAKKVAKCTTTYEEMEFYTMPLRKRKGLKNACKYNQSLNDFILSINSDF